MGRFRFLAILAVCLVGGLSSTVRAQATYDFVTDNNNGDYSVLPDGTVVVHFYFRETLANAATPSVFANPGVFASDVRVTQNTPAPLDLTPATITGVSRDTTNFDFPVENSTPTQAQVGGARIFLSPLNAPIIVDSPTVRRISLGTVTFQAGITPLATTAFTLDDRPDTTDDLLTDGTTALDGQIVPRTFTISVLPVPEPACGLVLAGVGGFLLARRRRTMPTV